MTTSLDTRIRRSLGMIAAATVVACVGAGSAAADGRPAASYYTKQQLQAMSQSWAARGALSSVSNVQAALASLPSETRKALLARLEQTPVVTGSQSTFEWGDFGIGAAGMLGLVLLAGGAFLAVRFGRRSGRVPAQRPV
jgi:hypothetical protein